MGGFNRGGSSSLKRCPKCKTEKELSDFSKNKNAKDGVGGWCKVCKRADRDRYLLVRGRKPHDRVKAPDGHKYCAKCKTVKPHSIFNGIKSLSPYCRDCMYAYNEIWRRAKGEKKKRMRDLSLTAKGLKECFHCYKVLELSEFSPTPRGVAKVSAYCKKCLVIRAGLEPKDKRNKRAREWKRSSPKWAVKHREHQHRRRAQKECCEIGIFLQSDLDRIYQNEICFYCRLIIEREKRTLDHVTPLSLGGAHSPSNSVMACGRCNFSKHNKSLEIFVERFDVERQNLIIRELGELGIDGYTSESRVTTRIKEPCVRYCSLYMAADI